MLKIKRIVRRLWHVLRSQSLVLISDDPYSSHIPILIGISKFYNIRSVLEFGSGPNSTVLFLDRRAFPVLEKLMSYENDSEWFKKVKKLTANDQRAVLNYCEGAMVDCVNENVVNNYDIVFIDDSICSKDRAETIRSVLKCRPNLVIIHDFENFAYRKAAGISNSSYRFKALLPNTGICSENLDRTVMQTINRVIYENSQKIKSDDISAWVNVFSAL